MFALPCAATCEGVHGKDDARFHVTCLWCRKRRGYKLGRHLQYGYLSMPKERVWAYKIDRERKIVYEFPATVPRMLLIDAAGHFTAVRCGAIMALDKLAAKIGLIGCHPLANLFEFLANYPVW